MPTSLAPPPAPHQVAGGAALTPLTSPAVTAVVGASAHEKKLGYAVMNNIIQAGYQGRLLPVNPRADEILGHACYPDIAAAAAATAPEPIDLAVIVIPGEAVLPVAEACGQAGVRSLVVISAGFREVGPAGLEAEKQLVHICRRYNMRMLGPNCLGIMDTFTPINASFAAGFPLKGEIAFISQSGALCASILDWSLAQGMGFSKFVSLGNKADLDESDFIADAAQDPYSRVVMAYIEDIHDGPRFLEVARRASRHKPVLVLKSGVSQAGAKAASSHTGALAGSDRAYATAFRQSGVLRANNMQEFFDLAMAFAHLPIPGGNRVAIVTNSGGPGILTSDAVELAGLQMAQLSKATIDTLREHLPAEAALYNPVDLIGDADAERYRLALETVLQDPGVDSVLVLLTPTASTKADEVAKVVAEIKRRHPAVPMVGVFMGGAAIRAGERTLLEAGIPSYFAPERAVAALRGVTDYGTIRDLPSEPHVLSYPGLDRERVADIFAAVRADGRRVLLGSEAAAVAHAYGIPAAPTILATTPEQAMAAAAELGGKVVLKVASPKILHKTDVGGVKIGLDGPEAVREGFIEILESVHRHLGPVPVHGVEVQPLLPKGRELIIGVSRDATFGPLIMFGLGGIYVNLLEDVSFRLAQGLSRAEVETMITETKAWQLLRGFRGEEPADLETVIETVARVACLARDFPEIEELDVNPLVAYTEGASALDVKITIA